MVLFIGIKLLKIIHQWKASEQGKKGIAQAEAKRVDDLKPTDAIMVTLIVQRAES